MTTTRTLAALLAALVFGSLMATGCKPQYVRGSEKDDIDQAAMSMRFDRRDLNKLYDKTVDRMMSASIVQQWNRQSATGDAPVVAIFPMRNETSQDLALDALLSKFETDLVNQTSADVVSHENQAELIAEIKRQQSEAYNPKRLANYGQQLGAQYFVTGKVYGVREQVKREKRQQYFMFVQILNVETGVVEFQSEESITKGFVK
jgi:uncharacterized protein (TIGR02722 family)